MDLGEIFPDSNKVAPKATVVTAKDGHTYHKSSSANASEAPTNQGTLDKAKAAQEAMVSGLSPMESDFIMMCQTYYNVHNTLIPSEVAVKRYGITPEIYDNLLNSEAVQATLKVAEIITDQAQQQERLLRKDQVLTPRQLMVADIMLDMIDSRSEKKRLQDNGVSTLEWSRWLRQPAFQAYLMERTDKAITDGQHEFAMALMDGVRAGNPKMLALYAEYTGRFVPKGNSGTTVNVNNNNVSADLQYMVAHMIEIITDEVSDGPTAARIADRMKALIGQNRVQTQMQLDSAPIVIPDTAPMRDHTSTIAAIEARAGVGDKQ